MIMKVWSDGRVTIPAELRRKLGIEPGSRVEMVATDDGLIIRPVKGVMEVYGALNKYAKYPVPDWNEVREATQRAVAEQVMEAARRSAEER